MLKNRNYEDLARAVYYELRKRNITSPPVEVLAELFATMYYVSLRTEERDPTAFHIVYMDPHNPDPDPPRRITYDRWSYIRFDHTIDATVTNLIKIAKASDQRTSSFAIYHNTSGKLFLWGLVDQGNTYFDFVNYESQSGSARPGIFQASIAGIGHIITYIGFQKIAELKVDALLRNVLDVFSGGPVNKALAPGIEKHLIQIRKRVSAEIYEMRGHWDISLISNWIESLCRLLLRTQKYRHGGALLISPGLSSRGVNIKYALKYARLRRALETQAILEINSAHISDLIWEEYIEVNAESVPSDLHLEESIAREELDDNRRELDGAIWFVSLLTRVDGLVLLTPRLDVRGFGVEITYSDEPATIFLAGNRGATKTQLKELDYNHFGTRHRSMMRYCAKVPGSVGFVVSQDGDVRAMTQVRGAVVVWENIKLQYGDFVRRKQVTQKSS